MADLLVETTASMLARKKNPLDTVAIGEGFAVAILNRNAPVFYCEPRDRQ